VLTLQAKPAVVQPLAYTKTADHAGGRSSGGDAGSSVASALTRVERFDFGGRGFAWLRNRIAGGRRAVRRGATSQPAADTRCTTGGAMDATRRWAVIGGALAVGGLVTIPVSYHLGSESMPPLDEGSLMYMPTTAARHLIGQAQQLLQATDHIIRQFPEVDRGAGKAGRAETATDPAAALDAGDGDHPEAARGVAARGYLYSAWAPEWARAYFATSRPIRISTEELVSQMNGR